MVPSYKAPGNEICTVEEYIPLEYQESDSGCNVKLEMFTFSQDIHDWQVDLQVNFKFNIYFGKAVVYILQESLQGGGRVGE